MNKYFPLELLFLFIYIILFANYGELATYWTFRDTKPLAKCYLRLQCVHKPRLRESEVRL